MRPSTFALLLSACLVAACTQLSPAGVLQASRLNPLETTAGDLAVAVSVPDALRLTTGDASVFLGFVPDDPARAPVEATLPLTIITPGDALPMAGEGQRVFVFQLTGQDAARFSDTQSRIKALRAAGVDGQGTFSVSLTGGCYTGTLDDLLVASVWMRTSPAGGFTQMIRTTSLYDLLETPVGAEVAAALRRC